MMESLGGEEIQTRPAGHSFFEGKREKRMGF